MIAGLAARRVAHTAHRRKQTVPCCSFKNPAPIHPFPNPSSPCKNACVCLCVWCSGVEVCEHVYPTCTVTSRPAGRTDVQRALTQRERRADGDAGEVGSRWCQIHRSEGIIGLPFAHTFTHTHTQGRTSRQCLSVYVWCGVSDDRQLFAHSRPVELANENNNHNHSSASCKCAYPVTCQELPPLPLTPPPLLLSAQSSLQSMFDQLPRNAKESGAYAASFWCIGLGFVCVCPSHPLLGLRNDTT